MLSASGHSSDIDRRTIDRAFRLAANKEIFEDMDSTEQY